MSANNDLLDPKSLLSVPPTRGHRNLRHDPVWVCPQCTAHFSSNLTAQEGTLACDSSFKVVPSCIYAGLISPWQVEDGVPIFCNRNVPDFLVNGSLQLVDIIKSLTPDPPLDPVKQPEVTGHEIRTIRWMRVQFNVMSHQESMDISRPVCGCSIMVQNPVSAGKQSWPPPSHTDAQLPQHAQVLMSVDSLATGHKLPAHKAAHVEETNQHDLDTPGVAPWFVRSGVTWSHPHHAGLSLGRIVAQKP